MWFRFFHFTMVESRLIKVMLKYAEWGLLAAVLLLAVWYSIRIFVCDTFTVKGVSMEPVCHNGDKVWVNKLKMGARIYTDYDFSKSELSSFRMPGFSKVRVGDLVVVNYPYACSKDSISFRINYVYLKRCYGAPGDTVRISNGYYLNHETGGYVGDIKYQKILSETPDSILKSDGVVLIAFQVDKSQKWTIKDFGPLYVPEAGSKVYIDIHNYRMWQRLILFETGVKIVKQKNRVYFRDASIDSYTFRSNWYFLGGDNVLNSRDSRYIGLFPESYIIGVVW